MTAFPPSQVDSTSLEHGDDAHPVLHGEGEVPDFKAWALWYASQGIPVGPLYPMNVDNSCTCRQRAACTRAGKHPLSHDPDTGVPVCPHGHLDYTTDAVQITEWWDAHPNAGIGGDLARAGLVDVSSDGFRWLWEFESRGLSPTATFQSSQAGHQHHLYQRTDDCPTARICKSGEYDILSDGNVVLPPTAYAPDKYRVWLSPDINLNGSLPPPPTWAVEMLKEAAARRDTRSRIPSAGAGSGAEADRSPPVRLSDPALEWWHGTRWVQKKDEQGNPITGAIDRSESLWAIGMELARANASAAAIAAALAERDEALTWRCYTDRPDAAERYAIIAGRVIAEVENEGGPAKRARNVPPPAPSRTDPEHAALADQLARAREQRRALEQERDELRRRCEYGDELRRAIMDTLGVDRTKATPGERIVIVNAALELDAKASRGAWEPGKPVRIAIGENVPTTRKEQDRSGYSLAAKSGVSRDTAGDAIERLIELGVTDGHTSELGVKRDGHFVRDKLLILHSQTDHPGLDLLQAFLRAETVPRSRTKKGDAVGPAMKAGAGTRAARRGANGANYSINLPPVRATGGTGASRTHTTVAQPGRQRVGRHGRLFGGAPHSGKNPLSDLRIPTGGIPPCGGDSPSGEQLPRPSSGTAGT